MNADAPVRALAFDLDGTLVDSVADIGRALNQALGEAGLGGCTVEQVRAWVGDGPDPLIARALAALGVAADAGLPLRLRRSFDRETLAAPLAQGAVFDGIAALLRTLQADWPLVVVTNKPSALARAVLDAAGLLPHFRAVYGADDAALRKPAPAMLQRAARELAVPATQLLMVGDSAADMQAAAAAGAPAVWVGWGYGVAGPAASIARWRIERPHQLLALLGAG